MSGRLRLFLSRLFTGISFFRQTSFRYDDHAVTFARLGTVGSKVVDALMRVPVSFLDGSWRDACLPVVHSEGVSGPSSEVFLICPGLLFHRTDA